MTVLLIAAVLALGLLGVREWLQGRVTLTFVRSDGVIPELELTVFPDQLSFTMPSPPPPLGQVRLLGDTSVTFDGDLVPGRAVVRYSGEGVGSGVVFVELGQNVDPIPLASPRTIRGRVGEPIGFWTFGWRCAGLRPVNGAVVVALAGGERGIEVASTRSDEQGWFELSGIAIAVHPLSLRVRAAGYAINHIAIDDPAGTAPVVAAVQPTTAIEGSITAPESVDLTRLCVLARGLPGVQVYPSADGAFILDHVPPGVGPRLSVHGLDAFHGCAEVRASHGAVVELEVVAAAVVRGTVVDGKTGEPIAGALVFAGDAAAVRSGDDGTFELTRVLPGGVELTAQYRPKTKKRRREPVRYGRARVDLRGGETLDGIALTVD